MQNRFRSPWLNVSENMTNRWTFADEAMRSVTSHSTGASIAARFPLTAIKHFVTALTWSGPQTRLLCDQNVVLLSKSKQTGPVACTVPVYPVRHSQRQLFVSWMQLCVPRGSQGLDKHSLTSPSQRSPTYPAGQMQWYPPTRSTQRPWLKHLGSWVMGSVKGVQSSMLISQCTPEREAERKGLIKATLIAEK